MPSCAHGLMPSPPPPKLLPAPYLLPISSLPSPCAIAKTWLGTGVFQQRLKNDSEKRLSERPKQSSYLKNNSYLCPGIIYETLNTHNPYGKNRTETTRTNQRKDRKRSGLYMAGHPLFADVARPCQESTYPDAAGPTHPFLRGPIPPSPPHTRLAHRIPRRNGAPKRLQRGHVLHHALCAEGNSRGHRCGLSQQKLSSCLAMERLFSRGTTTAR